MIAVVRHAQNYGSLKDHLAAFLFLFAGVIYCAWSLLNESRKSRGPNSGVGEASPLGPRDVPRAEVNAPVRGSARTTANQPRREQPRYVPLSTWRAGAPLTRAPRRLSRTEH